MNNITKNFLWRLAERVGAQGVTLIVSIILARILDPDTFGTLSLVTVFITILQVFIDSGLGTSLIQKKEADDIDFSTVFFFNLTMCVVLYIAMFLAAPLIAAFYNREELVSVIRVVSVVLIISGIKNIQHAYVARNMLFKRFFFATLAGTIGAAAIGIGMAYKGFGVWALVAQYIFNAAVDTIILWATVKWRPKFVFSFQRLKSLLSFGWKLLGVSLLNTIYIEIRSLLIGKIYSVSDLAYYNKAQQFPQKIAINIDTSIDSILLPTMSQKQDNLHEVKFMTRQALRLGTYFIMPLMLGFAACARPFVSLILTDKWLPCVPYLQIFCLMFSFYSVLTTNYNAYKAIGRSDVYLRVTVISEIFGIIVLAIGINYGVISIAIGTLISSFINQIICCYYTKRLIGYTIIEQLKDIIPNIIASLLMCICVYPISLTGLDTVIILILQICVGAVSYILLSIALKLYGFNYVAKKIRIKK